ncbi:hypothetical protein OS493_010506 [Desmophyllum pertusum]|uniref:Alpha/beta hydrolase fold-3 domain-containing protein n=1 Tax=Desmophyllum pertusum TaxID=174260 RepID=A0A9X0DAS3_9CNID|nr:hypothetical protein OS493_010506 [Desmophyllum pertusum]
MKGNDWLRRFLYTLQYSFLDFSLPSYKKQDTPLLTRHGTAAFWSYYMTGTPNMLRIRGSQSSEETIGGIPKVVLDALTDYRASPLMADNLKGLPKTLLITCEFDVLKDDGLLYKSRLLDAAVKVTHFNYMTYHAFLTVQSSSLFVTEEFNQAVRDIVDYLKEL